MHAGPFAAPSESVGVQRHTFQRRQPTCIGPYWPGDLNRKVIFMDALELTRTLLHFDTTNPPGHEAACGRFISSLLEQAGFKVECQEFDTHRLNIVATLAASNSGDAPLVLTGHIDTVPLGATSWSVDPFRGEIREGRLYGRGASDMKAGVAAMMIAAIQAARLSRPLKRGLTLIFTSGEETGCVGALALAKASPALLGRASAMIVGEPTGNKIATGHKGCMAMRARATGVTAHSSMPEKGVNAIYAAAKAISSVEQYRPVGAHDELLGFPTINVGMIEGGLNYNSVPDHAQFTIDVRSTRDMSHDLEQSRLSNLVGDGITLERFVDMPPVTTPETDPFVGVVENALIAVYGSAAPLDKIGLPFFSDASVFHPRFDCPTVILGPGEPDAAHQTDEYCHVEKIEAAVSIYQHVINAWCLND